MQRLAALPWFLVPALLLAGCGTSGAGGDPAPSVTTSPPAVGDDEVVLQVSVGGGFVPVESHITSLPSFTLLGDGTVIVPGAVRAIYPGPAMPPLNSYVLTEAEVQQITDRARSAGLLDGMPPDYGDMAALRIADAATTTVTLNLDGRTVTHRAYALDLTEEGPGTELPEAMRRARAALAGFVASLPRRDGLLDRYQPESLAVFVGPYEGEPMSDDPPVIWPLSSDLATVGREAAAIPGGYRCAEITGEDAARLRPLLDEADSRTRWTARGDTTVFSVLARPMVPGDPGCPRQS